MKKIILGFSLLALCVMSFCAFNIRQDRKPVEDKVHWYTWDEAVKANSLAKKKIFIDVYTDWCSWCKTMDKETFTNDKVAAYLNANFYPVKLNAEQKEDIYFGKDTFRFVMPEGSRRGVNTLAYSLLEGKMGYPTVVYLSENYERILIAPGFKTPDDIMPQLRYTAEEQFKTKTWEEFVKGQ